MVRILARDPDFIFDKTMLTPMDLFKEINKREYFPIVNADAKPRVV
jgi:hypothetical protein